MILSSKRGFAYGSSSKKNYLSESNHHGISVSHINQGGNNAHPINKQGEVAPANKFFIKSEMHSPKHEDKLNNFINSKKNLSPTQPVKVSLNMATKQNQQAAINTTSSNYLTFNKGSLNMNSGNVVNINLSKSNFKNESVNLEDVSKKIILSGRKNVTNIKQSGILTSKNCNKNSILQFSKSGSKEKVDMVNTESSVGKVDFSGQNIQHASVITPSNTGINIKHNGDSKEHSGLNSGHNIGNNHGYSNHEMNNFLKSAEHNEASHLDKQTDKFFGSGTSKQKLTNITSFATNAKIDLLLKPKINNYLVEKKIVSPGKDLNVNSNPVTTKYVPLKAKATSLQTKKNQTVSEIKVMNSSALKAELEKGKSKKIIDLKMSAAKQGSITNATSTNFNSLASSQTINFGINSNPNTCNNTSHVNVTSNNATNVNSLTSTKANLKESFNTNPNPLQEDSASNTTPVTINPSSAHKKQLQLLNSANKNKVICNLGTRNKKDSIFTLNSGGTTSSKVLSEKSIFLNNTNHSQTSKVGATTVGVIKENKENIVKITNKSSINPASSINLKLADFKRDKTKPSSKERIEVVGKSFDSIKDNQNTKTQLSYNKKVEISLKSLSKDKDKSRDTSEKQRDTKEILLSKETKTPIEKGIAIKPSSPHKNTNNTNTNTNSHQNSISLSDVKIGHVFNQVLLLEKFCDCLNSYEKEELRLFNNDIYYIGFLNRKFTSLNSRDSNLDNMNIKEKRKQNDNHGMYESLEKKPKVNSNDSSIINVANMKNRVISDENNYGFDDANGNYLIQIGDHINFRYEIISELGRGSFGQAVKCLDHKTGEMFCIKIIKNKKKFVEQAKIEIKILEHIADKDPSGEANVVKILDHFYFRNHICIVFELLETNLYELLKSFDFQGLDLSVIRKIAIQLLFTLNYLYEESIIHCDLKPENILLRKNGKTGIKVIDFGSSCFENEKLYSYIQSRFYRSPEVIMGLGYSCKIDMWSFGCIISELFTGVPIFPGENERDQLFLMSEYLGLPPGKLIDKSRKKTNFFDEEGNLLKIPNSRGKIRQPNTKDIRKFLRGSEEGYVDLVLSCFEWDQEKRITPEEALNHPWILEGMPKEMLNSRRKVTEEKKEKENQKQLEINQTQKSNYLSFKSNQMKNTKNTRLVNLTTENKMNSKLLNSYKM